MQVSGRAIGQELMSEIVCPFLNELKFNVEGYASEYTAYEHNNTKILLNPKVQFGQPLVENTGYPADVLYQSYFLFLPWFFILIILSGISYCL